MEDTLNVIEQPDGSFQLEWDKDDQKWNWLNGKTSEEISAMMTEAIQLALKEND